MEKDRPIVNRPWNEGVPDPIPDILKIQELADQHVIPMAESVSLDLEYMARLQKMEDHLWDVVTAGVRIKRALSLSLPMPWWRRPIRWIMAKILIWDTYVVVLDQIDQMARFDVELAEMERKDFLEQWHFRPIMKL